MPSWRPDWVDVDFDHAAAAAAVTALRSTARLVDTQADARVRLAATAQAEWRGRARVVFDAELRRMSREAADLADGCRRAAAAIEAAADEARVEQRRRVDDRERWRDELRREQAAAVASASAGAGQAR